MLEGEDTSAYNELLARISGTVKPADVLEEIWVRDIVDLTWEVFRWRRLKATLIAATEYKGIQPILETRIQWLEAVIALVKYIFLRRVILPSARKKSLSPKREDKSERLELRLAPSAKKLIQQAMSVTGLAAGDLAYEGARRLLDEHQRMVLSGADRVLSSRRSAGHPIRPRVLSRL